MWSWSPGAETCATRGTRVVADATKLRFARAGAIKPVPGEITYKPFKPSRREGRVRPAGPVVPAACIFFAGGPRASVEVRSSLRLFFNEKRTT
ncbi:conserved hypothetical protein [Bradyrhizobium sp. STM 3843]|nr:conserved hypothetical protein [Bradyrhizobium sp. STM 3843]